MQPLRCSLMVIQLKSLGKIIQWYFFNSIYADFPLLTSFSLIIIVTYIHMNDSIITYIISLQYIMLIYVNTTCWVHLVLLICVFSGLTTWH